MQNLQEILYIQYLGDIKIRLYCFRKLNTSESF